MYENQNRGSSDPLDDSFQLVDSSGRTIAQLVAEQPCYTADQRVDHLKQQKRQCGQALIEALIALMIVATVMALSAQSLLHYTIYTEQAAANRRVAQMWSWVNESAVCSMAQLTTNACATLQASVPAPNTPTQIGVFSYVYNTTSNPWSITATPVQGAAPKALVPVSISAQGIVTGGKIGGGNLGSAQ
jgi:hypothetical protein